MSKEDNTDIELPSKPWSPMKNAILQGTFGTAFGLGASAAWQALLNWAHKRQQTFNIEGIVNYALSIGLLSAVIGWYTAKGEAKEYGFKTDTVKLQRKIERLEAEKTERPPSFVKDVAASKETNECQYISR